MMRRASNHTILDDNIGDGLEFGAKKHRSLTFDKVLIVEQEHAKEALLQVKHFRLLNRVSVQVKHDIVRLDGDGGNETQLVLAHVRVVDETSGVVIFLLRQREPAILVVVVGILIRIEWRIRLKLDIAIENVRAWISDTIGASDKIIRAQMHNIVVDGIKQGVDTFHHWNLKIKLRVCLVRQFDRVVVGHITIACAVLVVETKRWFTVVAHTGTIVVMCIDFLISVRDEMCACARHILEIVVTTMSIDARIALLTQVHVAIAFGAPRA
mmetsp:Transcript_32836/g.53299  ORF Transcript_32836/g.53299 Transcript_32836/m.53299 type:complete len:268 (+) Transcript_32836:3-806(+)